MSIGFDRDRNRKVRELTNSKNRKGKYHLKIMLKDVFDFSEHQKRGTLGLGYEVTLTRKSDNSVLKKDNATMLVKLNLLLLIGMFHIIHPLAPNKVFYLNRF